MRKHIREDNKAGDSVYSALFFEKHLMEPIPKESFE